MTDYIECPNCFKNTAECKFNSEDYGIKGTLIFETYQCSWCDTVISITMPRAKGKPENDWCFCLCDKGLQIKCQDDIILSEQTWKEIYHLQMQDMLGRLRIQRYMYFSNVTCKKQ